MISWQARVIKLFCRVFIKRAATKPAPSPAEGIRRLRRSLERYDPYNRRFTRGLQVRYVESNVRGEWLLPHGRGVEKAILYVHGGGFVACSPLSHRRLTTALARESGVALFSVDYRLAPEHAFPAALDDVLAAFDAIVASGVHPQAIVLAGDSAGGGLVLSAALALTMRGRDALPAGVVAYSPWTDLLASGASIRKNARSDDMLVGANVAQSARNYVQSDAVLRNPLASPLYGELAGLPRMLVFASTSEVLLDDAVRFAQRARAAGSPVDLELERSMPHVWPIFYDMLPEAKRTVAHSVAFIKQCVAPPVAGRA